MFSAWGLYDSLRDWREWPQAGQHLFVTERIASSHVRHNLHSLLLQAFFVLLGVVAALAPPSPDGLSNELLVRSAAFVGIEILIVWATLVDRVDCRAMTDYWRTHWEN